MLINILDTILQNNVRLAHSVTKIRRPPATPHASGAKTGSRCEDRAYKPGFI